MRRMLISGVVIILSVLFGCQLREKIPEGYDVVTAKAEPIMKQLYFSGTIQPIRSYYVTSPVEGVIEKKQFEYGSQLTQAQSLFSIRSTDLEKEYRDSLASYLKAKEQYLSAKLKLHDDEALYKAGIVATNDYHASQNNLNDAYLSFLQAQQALDEVLSKAHLNVSNAKQLEICNGSAVSQALLMKFDALNVTSPAQGIALLPEKGAGADNDSSSNTKFIIGSPVKNGQVIVTVGDMSGVSLEVSVNQVDINSIKPGQHAVVTSDAFPGVVLTGNVVQVSAQASLNATGGIPTFPVRVEVPTVPTVVRNKIAVGMSAMVKIDIQSESQVMVPINAVSLEGEVSKVKKVDKYSGKIVEVPVETGPTTFSSVVILNGIQSGDRILVHHAS